MCAYTNIHKCVVYNAGECQHTHIYIYTYKYMYMLIYTQIYIVHVFEYTFIPIHTYTYKHMGIWYIFVSTDVYISTYVCTHIYMLYQLRSIIIPKGPFHNSFWPSLFWKGVWVLLAPPYLPIEVQLAQTPNGKVIGYFMGTKIAMKSGGWYHLSVDLFVCLDIGPWFGLELKRHCEKKAHGAQFLVWWHVRYKHGVGVKSFGVRTSGHT